MGIGSGTIPRKNIQDGQATESTLQAVLAALGGVGSQSLKWISSASSDVDNSAVLVFDCSAADASAVAVCVTNCGTGDVFLRVGGSDPVADSSTAFYDFKLALGESRWIMAGYKASSTDNDIKAIRAAAQTNDNVIVSVWGWA